MKKEEGTTIIASHVPCFIPHHAVQEGDRRRLAAEVGEPCSSSPPSSVWTAPPLPPDALAGKEPGTSLVLSPGSSLFPPNFLAWSPRSARSRICFAFGLCERGQKQRAILVSGQEVFAQPHGQML